VTTRPVEIPDDVSRRLAAAYGEPHRAYHDARHLDEVLGWFDAIAAEGGWLRPAEVYVAMLFHDAVYDVARKDNEARSAAWAREALAGHPAWAAIDADRVAHLILLTARHASLTPADVAGDRDAARFLDCDMAIVGAPAARFDEYERAIAVEYGSVPRDAFRAGRRAFLERLAAAPRIYLDDWMHARLDAAARGNLARAIAALH